MVVPRGVAPADYEELRIALVMNGGVSLAVWIGGVAHEINEAVRGDGLYGELLELTATTARVDVISGASAGGINGALLALALAYDADLAQLRDVWIERGSLDALLRSPYDPDSSSLLLGNDRFFDDLRDAFRRVRGTGPPRPAEEVPLHLTLSTTILHGEPSATADDLGAVIGDVNHRGRFEFARGEGAERDAFADPQISERLALAARASASFPVAFEPVFCPVTPEKAVEDRRFLDMAGVASLKSSRFLVDGGVLDNKPLESALRAIFRQRTSREVRRVLAYVVPSPGETAVERADEVGEPPTLAEVALASLIELPRAESISAQLESILDHNRLVRRKRDTRSAIVRELQAEGMNELAVRLFELYRQRRLEGAADYIAERIAAGLADARMPGFTLGRRGREWLAQVLLGIGRAPWVPAQFPTEGDPAGAGGWSWGAYTIEHIAELLIDLFRRALLVSPLDGGRDHGLRPRLKEHYTVGYDLFLAMPRTRRGDLGFWASRVDGLAAVLAGGPDRLASGARGWAEECVRAWSAMTAHVRVGPGIRDYVEEGPPVGDAPRGEVLGWIASAMAAVISKAAPDIRMAALAGRDAGRTPADQRAAADLLRYIDFLAPEGANAGANTEIVLRRLLTLEVVQHATGIASDVPDQFVELVQVSANLASPLGGRARAAEKLGGAQLANFGGFYKKAWRANDWMFGRMDGADRLVRVLLNPARLARLYRDRRQDVLDEIHRLAVSSKDERVREFLEQRWRAKAPAVESDLEFLQRPDLPVPEQLPQAVEALVTRLHFAILQDEVPELVGAAEDDLRRGAGKSGATAALVAAARRKVGPGTGSTWKNLPPRQLVEIFAASRVGEERLASEVGTDLFASTLTRSLAVAITMVSGPRAGLGPVRRVLQVMRLPLLIVDALARNAAAQSRTSAFLSGVLLTLSSVIVAVHLLVTDLPFWMATIGGVVFVASIALALRRQPRLALVWLVLSLVTAGVWRVAPALKDAVRRGVVGVVGEPSEASPRK